ncbi:MAG: sensor histidine kinase [Longimicrobiales bacterium]
MRDSTAVERKRRSAPPSYERRILLLAALAGLPGVVVALLLLWMGEFEPRVRWTLAIFMVAFWWIVAATLRERVVRPLQALSNLLAALREGDYSFRSRRHSMDDALGLALEETNALAERLRSQRLGEVEATELLQTVIEEIDVAIFAFDDEARLRLVNRAGERLLGDPARRLLGRTADEVGLAECLRGDAETRTFDAVFPGGGGRWELRRGAFRQGGRPHQLLVLTDLSRALREEERQAWQRLVRVLGHEINNSLAPIKSIAASLRDLLARERPPPDLGEDLGRGLGVIATRADALGRFMTSYARLARLPPPRPGPVDVAELLRRVAQLETRLPVRVEPGPPITIRADADQLEQLLINLVTNAVDASLETGGGVDVGWSSASGQLEVWIRDQGPGLPNTTNLFVPFFTTKPHGSGIGLALCRQIAEAHGGSIALANRNGRGCEARVRLPVG